MNVLRRALDIAALIALFDGFVCAQSPQSLRSAVGRALPILQRSAGEFIAKRTCISCHHNILPILTFHLARSRGFEVDVKILGAVEDKTFRQLREPNALDNVIQAATLSDPTPNDSFLLLAAQAAGLPRDLTMAVYASRLIRWQRDGHWITSDFRPPHSSSEFTATATAVRAIRLYAAEQLGAESDEAVGRARKWLFKQRPLSTEDATFRLLGLVWTQAPPDQIRSAAHDLIGRQQPKGGWPQLPGYEADAYSTGEALFALREAGIPATDRVWVKGANFLISSQAADGTWHVHTRMLSPAEVSPKYFPTGFPYGKDEFLSYAGSCWAVMALLSALPESGAASEPVGTPADVTPPWIATALFGTAPQLAALLDAGLDPNNRTAGGTTILMAAAHDAEKVRLLIFRGASVAARAASGADALTIAAAYRDTARALQALLDAGADAQPPEGVHVRRTPLVLASMTGDLENVRLLLERGAKPSAEALSEAVTFGYPDVVRTLIAAGADAGIAESSGINLLHWAVIANRSAVIPVLIQAHVPLNETDANGYTPLMYAATIDFGDTNVMKELLKAGADRSIRNPEGRTPLAQARHFRHAQLEAVLR